MTTRVTPTTPPQAAPARTARTTGWPLLNLVKKIMPGQASTPPGGNPPAQRPSDRTAAAIDSIGSYTPGARVWAYIGSAWLAATIVSRTDSSTLVTYTVPGSGDLMVETVHTTRLQLRDRAAEERSRGDVIPPSGAPDAGRARAVLGAHCADEHGMCAACAYLAHFCWAPCPQARQATLLLAAHVAPTGGA